MSLTSGLREMLAMKFAGSASSRTGSDRRLAPERYGYDRPETQARSVFSGIRK